jgi:hypothetical protein
MKDFKLLTWLDIRRIFRRKTNYGTNLPENIVSIRSEVLNVKILRIVPKLCIGIGDTKFDQLMTLFSIDNGFYLGKTQRL